MCDPKFSEQHSKEETNNVLSGSHYPGLKANAPGAGPHNLPSTAALKHYCISGAVRCLRGCWLVGHRAAKGLIFGAWGVDLAACGLHLAADGRHMQHIA